MQFYLPSMDGKTKFPPIEEGLIEPNGLLAFGGDLNVETLINAYSLGIFPWYSDQEPILWWSPNPRLVLFPHKFHISRSFQRTLNKTSYTVHFDRDFNGVINQCSKTRKDGNGTWITEGMKEAYHKLFNKGIAHCLEIDVDGKLIGAIYGVALKNIFYGESMFSIQTNGSKIALLELCKYLMENNYKILDCQAHSAHLVSMGAELISIRQFKQYLPKY
jgi:leucyl/phenylalanyl-tRNA--protein transferase